MKITPQTTITELYAERVRLGIEHLTCSDSITGEGPRVRLLAQLADGGAASGLGADYFEAFGALFASVERKIAEELRRAGKAPPGVCHLAPFSASARCGVHDVVPDWTSEIPGYTGPSGWICPVSKQLLADRPQRVPHTEDGVTHEQIDDEDDHRVLVMRCGERFGFIPAEHREPQKDEIDCARCDAAYVEVRRG